MRNVRRYVEGYNLCQQIKNRMEEITGKLKLREVLERLWTHILVDFITKLLVVAERKAILVVYDRFSKIIYFVATIKGTSAEELAKLYRDNV